MLSGTYPKEIKQVPRSKELKYPTDNIVLNLLPVVLSQDNENT